MTGERNLMGVPTETLLFKTKKSQIRLRKLEKIDFEYISVLNRDLIKILSFDHQNTNTTRYYSTNHLSEPPAEVSDASVQ